MTAPTVDAVRARKGCRGNVPIGHSVADRTVSKARIVVLRVRRLSKERVCRETCLAYRRGAPPGGKAAVVEPPMLASLLTMAMSAELSAVARRRLRETVRRVRAERGAARFAAVNPSVPSVRILASRPAGASARGPEPVQLHDVIDPNDKGMSRLERVDREAAWSRTTTGAPAGERRHLALSEGEDVVEPVHDAARATGGGAVGEHPSLSRDTAVGEHATVAAMGRRERAARRRGLVAGERLLGQDAAPALARRFGGDRAVGKGR